MHVRTYTNVRSTVPVKKKLKYLVTGSFVVRPGFGRGSVGERGIYGSAWYSALRA